MRKSTPVALISASTLGSIRPRLRRRCGDHEILRQTFALRQVEDGEALEERDRLRFLAGLSRPFLLVVGNEAVGIDDGGAVLALADVAAEAEGLAKRQPALAGKPCSITAPQRISTLTPE